MASDGVARNQTPHRKTAVLFDLGGTLVDYFGRQDFPGVLKESIESARTALEQAGHHGSTEDLLWKRVASENFEAEDHRVRPLEDRLQRIFGLDSAGLDKGLLSGLCERFMRPIFRRGRLFDDALPVLDALKSRGIATALVSNTTWGSPAGLWHAEIARRGLSPYLDAVVFCRDVGWRKPAAQIFEYALEKLNRKPAECLFVGDDPRWDVAGPHSLGMDALLLERTSAHSSADDSVITHLTELLERLSPR